MLFEVDDNSDARIEVIFYGQPVAYAFATKDMLVGFILLPMMFSIKCR